MSDKPIVRDEDRCILHVDMDAFYASIEQRDNPDLRGKPVVVGGSGQRGVVAAASYEIRRFGVRSAMPGREAARRCPEAIFIKPRIDHYRSVSKKIFEIFRQTTPTYEGLSLDEAFLDLSGEPNILTTHAERAMDIKRQIFSATQLTASIGVGPNKLIAKIASDINKPDGLCVLFGENIQKTLDPMPVRTLPGIGKKTYSRLQQLNINTIKDLRSAPDAALAAVFGRYAMRIKQRAAGIDNRAVVPYRPDKSISAETTFDEDLTSLRDMHEALTRLADQTSKRARKKQLNGSVVAIKIRTADFKTRTRQMPLNPPSHASDVIGQRARTLFNEWREEFPDQRIRLLGVGISGLQQQKQLSLFDSPELDGNKVDQVLDNIREKYGDSIVKRGNRLR